MLDHFLRNGLTSAALVLLLSYLAHRAARQKLRALPTAAMALLSLCMAAVFQLTGVSAMNHFRLPNLADGFSFVPCIGMYEIVQTAVAYDEPVYAIANLGGNLLMFAPLGFLLPLLWKRFRKLWKTALFAFGTSLLIECTQTFVGRGFDVDDLLLNTLGAVLGYGAYRLLARLWGDARDRCTLAPMQNAPGRLLPYLSVLIPYAVSFCYGFLDRAIYLAA